MAVVANGFRLETSGRLSSSQGACSAPPRQATVGLTESRPRSGNRGERVATLPALCISWKGLPGTLLQETKRTLELRLSGNPRQDPNSSVNFPFSILPPSLPPSIPHSLLLLSLPPLRSSVRPFSLTLFRFFFIREMTPWKPYWRKANQSGK